MTAVAAYNDEVAITVLAGIRRAGLRCPADLAVIGMDEMAINGSMEPPLSSIEFDIDRLVWTMRTTREEQAALAKVGAMALRTKTVAERVRHAVIEQRIPVHAWPATPPKIPAIDAATGAFTVFNKSSGVDLVDAVAASCAVPMVWPPVTIGSKRYIDGGIRSVANVDLAAGYDRVVVITPGTQGLRKGTAPAAQLAATHASGSVIVSPDSATRSAMGRNALDPQARAASARTGLEQADRVAEMVRTAWA